MTTPIRRPPRGRGYADPHDLHPSTCAVDGATLDPTGWCPTGGGYPSLVWFYATSGTAPPYPRWAAVMASCPIACPYCTSRLDWQGWCRRCAGTGTPEDRATWTAPGDEYQYQVGGHWVMVTKGPRPTISDEAFRAVLRQVRQTVDRMQMPPTPSEAEA